MKAVKIKKVFFVKENMLFPIGEDKLGLDLDKIMGEEKSPVPSKRKVAKTKINKTSKDKKLGDHS